MATQFPQPLTSPLNLEGTVRAARRVLAHTRTRINPAVRSFDFRSDRIDGGTRTTGLTKSFNIRQTFDFRTFKRPFGEASEMRLYNNLVAGEKVRINPRGFVFEDVEACAGELMRFEGGDEGVAVEDSAAGGVDEVGVGFHLGEFGFANHVMGVFGERAVQGDDVGSLEKLLERLACHSSFRRTGRDATVSRKILYLHA